MAMLNCQRVSIFKLFSWILWDNTQLFRRKRRWSVHRSAWRSLCQIPILISIIWDWVYTIYHNNQIIFLSYFYHISILITRPFLGWSSIDQLWWTPGCPVLMFHSWDGQEWLTMMFTLNCGKAHAVNQPQICRTPAQNHNFYAISIRINHTQVVVAMAFRFPH